MRWMRFAGIVGIIAAVVGLVFSILGFVDISGLWFLIVSYIFSSILLIFFYFGFVKMGEYVKSKLVKISSWLVIISSILLVVLLIATSLLRSFIGQVEGILIPIVIFLPISWGVLLFSLILSIGLITIGQKVKFAKIAGILGIISFVFSGLGSFVGDFANISSWISFIPPIFKGIVFVFMSLSLFDASKKFENIQIQQ